MLAILAILAILDSVDLTVPFWYSSFWTLDWIHVAG
jgi:hypothetical protein